jgi:multicomponent Na+:H+ antiporter subunit E
MQMDRRTSPAWLISRLIIYTGTWWVLTKGAADSWPVGIPAVLAAIYADLNLFGPDNTRCSWRGLIAFVLFFLKSSIYSGMDVVRRVYDPRLPLDPAMVEYPLRLTSSAARNLFICTVSLLPGTLSTAIEGHKLVIHALDVGRPVEHELNIIENRVAAVFKHPVLMNNFKTEESKK